MEEPAWRRGQEKKNVYEKQVSDYRPVTLIWVRVEIQENLELDIELKF
jgi:hypothetical protein